MCCLVDFDCFPEILQMSQLNRKINVCLNIYFKNNLPF